MKMIKNAISKIVNNQHLSKEEMTLVMDELMEGRCTPAQIGGLLIGLRMKGETVEEITGAASVMREKALHIPVKLDPGEPLVDTCGTGGDGATTFNVSTTSAFVVAGAGIKVAKHGNRSVSSKSGSADVLETLGVSLDLSPEQVASAIEDIGIGFLFAPNLHPAMKHAIGPRKELGVRTIFNVLGPLTNPAGANVQLLGVFDPKLPPILAEVLGKMGARRAWVVHGHSGLDELSLTGPNVVAQWDGEKVEELIITPEDAGLNSCSIDDLSGGDPEENAAILMDILEGNLGPRRDMVLMNSGAVIYLAGVTDSLKDGVHVAAESIDSGAALRKLEALKKYKK